MKNGLIDLNDHLFEALERLNSEELQGEKLQQEIERSRAMTNVAQHIIANGKLLLDAQVALSERQATTLPVIFTRAGGALPPRVKG